ncbi:NAD(P)-binding domain-containing protein [Puia sp.]|uniref:NAD(P)-binding domain-containing protein n=1 Tax=Puia sp. TaxID=2045100 RepID=UPI0039C8FA84
MRRKDPQPAAGNLFATPDFWGRRYNFCTFHKEALETTRQKDHWHTVTNNGEYRSKYLVMATGRYNTPKQIDLKGEETFPVRPSIAASSGQKHIAVQKVSP